MGPNPSSQQTYAVFINRLNELINLGHLLVRLAGLIDWSEIERALATFFTSGRGSLALSTPLVAGLLYLQQTFDSSPVCRVADCSEWPLHQTSVTITMLKPLAKY